MVELFPYRDRVFLRICQIIEACEKDLKKDTLQTRDSYYQIKAFHYDSIAKLIKETLSHDDRENRDTGNA